MTEGPSLAARAVATPVLELCASGVAGVVAGVATTVACLDLGGSVVVLTVRGVPLMPNGVGLAEGPGALDAIADGAPVRLRAGTVQAGTTMVRWSPSAPPAWDPRVPEAIPDARAAVLARGLAMVRASVTGMPDGVDGGPLLSAVRERDPEAAGAAADALLGHGPGLIPAGDDLLAAVAATVASFGPAVGFAATTRWAWLAALLPPGLRERTTALSATLLELAAEGRVVEPLRSVLDLGAGEERWRPALDELLRPGLATGPSSAVAAGATAVALVAGAGMVASPASTPAGPKAGPRG